MAPASVCTCLLYTSEARPDEVVDEVLELFLELDADDSQLDCPFVYGFNPTSLPHAYYSKQYLLHKGVKENDFLEFVLSSNTVEDFRMSGSRTAITNLSFIWMT